MSLRPFLFGFDLSRFRSLLGSGDANAGERICAELASRISNAARLAEARDIARRAVMVGVPFVGLAEEGSAHVDAALALATFDQTLDDLESSTWNMQPIWHLQSVFPQLAEGPFRIFTRGTPIFGPRMKAGPYAFLASHDLERLRQDLASIHQTVVSLPDPIPLEPEVRAALFNELKEAARAVTDDESLAALLSRLLAEGLGFNERAIKDLAFAGAKKCGWPSSVTVATTLNRFLARFNQAQAKADPKRVAPFLKEMERWVSRLASSGRDLLFYAS